MLRVNDPPSRMDRTPRLVVTGASGYIGQRLCTLARDRGFDVVVLGTPPSGATDLSVYPWRLGEQPPAEAFARAAAVIHLAHAWVSDARDGSTTSNTNLTGTETLARAASAAGVPRFVLASTTSARLEALNAYGRIKHMIEQRLHALAGAPGRVICARIGLVYGGPEMGLYGAMSRFVRIAPVLPMIGLNLMVQPIHLDEAVGGLLALATRVLPQRNGVAVTHVVLAGPHPVPFGDWLRMLRRAHTGKPLWLVPVPFRVALVGCDLTRVLPSVPPVDRERVLGLAGATPMASADDLVALGIAIVSPAERLRSLPSQRRRRLAEARAMLAYVSGSAAPPKAAIARLVRAIDRQDATTLNLPRFAIVCPTTLRVFEPLRPRFGHRLVSRLHLAAMVMECAPGASRRAPRLVSLLAQALIETVAAPFRLIFGDRFA